MTQEKEIDIVSLDFPENVRTRPGMYVGSTDCPDVILREAIDNSVDELMGSIRCNRLSVETWRGHNGGWYVVSDNGRGIPIIMDEEKHITKCELAVGSLHAGSKFNKNDGTVSVGLNGVGISCTNALSERFVILSKITDDNCKKSIPEVENLYYSPNGGNNPYYVLEFNRGIKVYEDALIKDDIVKKYGFNFDDDSYTVTAFIPDKDIWYTIVADYNPKSLAYLKVILDKFYNKDALIEINKKPVESNFEPYKYQFKEDIEIWDSHLNRNKSVRFFVNFELDKNVSVSESTGSVNSLIVNRGLHIDWVKRAYGESLISYFNMNHDYVLYGIRLNVICLSSNADYASQTKERCIKLDNIYYEEIGPILKKNFKKLYKQYEEEFELHVERLNELYDSINQISAIQKVKQLVGTVEGGSRTRSKLPSTVKDAASNNRSDCELFIIEGKSAAGTMLKARNPEIHATLELRGIPLNAINLDLDTIMANPEMEGIVVAIGAGVNEYFKIENCRYGKIILAADSDSDGEKINSMILGFIAKKMTFLIEDGRVYVALAPLYHQKLGKRNIYVYPGQDPREYLDMDKPFNRYKGLGEINPAEAKDFFFNPNTRNLLQVTMANLDEVFDLLTTTHARKELMISQGIVTDPYRLGMM